MIRRIHQILPEEVERIADLGRMFYLKTGLSGEFHPDTFTEVWNLLLKQGIAVMWIHESGGHMDGTMGAVISPNLFDGKVTAQEQFWFVDPKSRGLAGLRLFKEFEKWAVEIKATRIITAHMDQVDGPIADFYERHKFHKLETHYVKELV